eukprot:1726902-Rhodomonas_salina.1
MTLSQRVRILRPQGRSGRGAMRRESLLQSRVSACPLGSGRGGRRVAMRYLEARDECVAGLVWLCAPARGCGSEGSGGGNERS